APSIESNVKKLKAGRIDAFLAYWPDAYTIFDEMGMPYLPHTANTPIAIHQDALLCRDDEIGKAVISNFNKGYKKIEINGSLAKIFAE
ncbi:MAG: hypothetical protein JKX94_06855, partial [Sneathiella sp.]|nr:hypothetical protein [Sneathiella sp.]